MPNIVVYSTHCPRCKILEKTLTDAGIEFSVNENIDIMDRLGIQSVPQMQIYDGELMDFKTAMNWVKENKNG